MLASCSLLGIHLQSLIKASKDVTPINHIFNSSVMINKIFGASRKLNDELKFADSVETANMIANEELGTKEVLNILAVCDELENLDGAHTKILFAVCYGCLLQLGKL